MKTPTKLSNEVKDFLFTVALGNTEPDVLAKSATLLVTPTHFQYLLSMLRTQG